MSQSFTSRKQGPENRRSPRRVFRRSIGLLYRGAYIVTRALQLSEGGLMLRCEWALSPGDQVVVTLILPDGGHCIVRTEILYPAGERGSYGAKFIDLPLPQRRMIRAYVSAKTQQEATEDSLN